MSEHSHQEPGDSPALVMYCRSWCGDCARARAWLDEHGIAYTEVDVDDDDSARSHAAGLNDGRLHTPTFTMGDGVCVDFRPEKLKDLLGM
jgi:mycoredoxin